MPEHMIRMRRDLLRAMMAGVGVSALPKISYSATERSEPVRFEPNWESFTTHYSAPEWYRDAKLGLWAHWGPQCEPGASDWYARDMYIQGTRAYDHHLKNYGHPSEFGFMDICNAWKADHWQPEELLRLYRKAGAKFFVAMANHHDNFDTYNSRYHNWNATRVGPKTDILARWAAAARGENLKFGISNHSSQAWHWTQVAYSYDAEGPQKGKRYDGFSKANVNSKGKWWEGLDPMALYSAPVLTPPDGLKTIEDMQKWQKNITGPWASPMKLNPAFGYQWALRTLDSIDQYTPDLIYFDDAWLPMGQLGLEVTARYYNMSVARNGRADVVVTGKALPEHLRSGIVEDVERGFSEDIRPHPWQSCTCIGNWHYDRELFERKGYKTSAEVIQRLIDVVSKNGTLLLSIPLPGNGAIDSEARRIVEELGAWTAVCGDGIFGTRPWKRYGEGPTQRKSGQFNESTVAPFTAHDIRFTTKSGRLYAFAMAWPEAESLIVRSLSQSEGTIDAIHALGTDEPLKFDYVSEGLRVFLPKTRPSITPGFVISGTVC